MIELKMQDWNSCMILDWGHECVVAAGSGMGRLVHTPSGGKLARSRHISGSTFQCWACTPGSLLLGLESCPCLYI